MNPMDQSRRRRSRPIGGRGCLLLSSVALMVMAGCESLASRQQPDPLLGIRNPPQPVVSPGSPASTPTQTAAAELAPPLPATYSAPGPAALTSGEAATTEQGRDLRITGDTSTTTSLPGNAAARGVAPSITVGTPVAATSGSTSHLVPVPTSGAAVRPIGVSTAAPPPGSAAANIQTFEEAQQFLVQHGVDCQHLEKVDNGWWKFDCSAPNPRNPSVRRTYETKGSFPDYLSAIRAVIVKMEETPR